MPQDVHFPQVQAAAAARKAAEAARKRAAAKKAAASQNYQKRRQEYLARQARLRQQAGQSKAKRVDARRARFEQVEQRRQQQADRRRRLAASHVVKRGDTIEGIAAKYNLSPQEALKQSGVERLRPGQELSFSRKEDKGYNLTSQQEEDIRRQGAGAINPTLEIASGVPGIRDLGREPSAQFPTSPIGMTDTQRQAALEAQSARYQYAYDAAQSVEIDEESRRQGLYMHSMRYTGEALQYAWMTGDTSVLKGTGQFSDQSIYLTDRMMREFAYDLEPGADLATSDVVKKIISMGYYQMEDGVWVLMDVEEPGYGMGGYEFPGYGDYGGYGGYGGVGGGGGEYKERVATSSFRGAKSGGRTRGEVKQLFAGNLSRSHWRI